MPEFGLNSRGHKYTFNDGWGGRGRGVDAVNTPPDSSPPVHFIYPCCACFVFFFPFFPLHKKEVSTFYLMMRLSTVNHIYCTLSPCLVNTSHTSLLPRTFTNHGVAMTTTLLGLKDLCPLVCTVFTINSPHSFIVDSLTVGLISLMFQYIRFPYSLWNIFSFRKMPGEAFKRHTGV